MKTVDFTSQEPVPVPDTSKRDAALALLSPKINDLFASLKLQKRQIKAARIETGKLLIKVRDMFGVRNDTGKRFASGKTGGTFCQYVEKQGWNLGTCYQYIAEAEGKPKPVVREAYWQAFNRKMKKATDRQKINFLRQACAHLITLYKIPATVVVQPR